MLIPLPAFFFRGGPVASSDCTGDCLLVHHPYKTCLTAGDLLLLCHFAWATLSDTCLLPSIHCASAERVLGAAGTADFGREFPHATVIEI